MGRPKLEAPSPKCKAPKCRRVARVDGYCKRCHEQMAASGNVVDFKTKQPAAPSGGNGSAAKAPAIDQRPEVVRKMTPAEAENWGRLRAEVQTHKQSVQLLAMKQRELQQAHEKQIADLEHKRRVQLAAAQEVQGQYEQITRELCDKYKTDRQYTVIDIDGRVIREERPGA